MTSKRGKTRLTEEYLRDVVSDQRRKGRAGRNQVEQQEFCEVQKLDLGSKRISRIERLWEFTSLTTLHLNNNSIHKMEGLSRLINLKSLNLSFNKIMKIEGLEPLKKLEELNLSSNKISVLENMETLEELVSLNMENNILKDLRQVLYLERFKNLFTINFCENPLSQEENYNFFIIAFFPNLKYLDYIHINREMKRQASDKFQLELQKHSLEDVERQREREELEAREAEQQMHADAFVESLNGSSLFKNMFRDDPLASKLQSVPQIVVQQTQFKYEMTGLCVQLFEKGLEAQARRQAEVNSFSTHHAVTTAEMKQKETELLLEFEKSFKEMKAESANTSQNVRASARDEEMKDVHKRLLTLEFKLVNEMEKMIKNLDATLAEMVGAFIETAQEIFAQCRELEDKYHETVQGIVAATVENVASDRAVKDMSDDVKMVFLDKETVMGALTTAHENHLVTLRERENLLITSANTWKSKFIKKLQEKELQRNRTVLSNIATYMDHYAEEVQKSFNRHVAQGNSREEIKLWLQHIQALPL